MDKNNLIDKVAFVYVSNRKILVTLSKGKDAWYIPGGKREQNETDHQTLIREVKEELSVDLIPQTINYFGTYEAQAHGKPEGTIVRMKCYIANFKGELKVSSEIEKLDFFTYSQKNQTSLVDYQIFDDLKGKNLID